jgi:hypothetical protein
VVWSLYDRHRAINQLKLHRKIIAVCSVIHTEHINALYEQNVEFIVIIYGGI